ncbi:MAG: hypothetical protein ACYS7Y_34665 [Planctomycetota bacterium]|jgi:hypothetical protein
MGLLKLHVHDCSKCEWLGTYKGADLYKCGDTILARFSSDGPDYASTSLSDWDNGIFDGISDHLHECARRYHEGVQQVIYASKSDGS